MLVRVVVKNLFSFREYTEFNLLPGKFNRLPHHVQHVGNVDVLKLSAVYGANGAGKSNLIRALALLQRLVMTGTLPIELITQTYKLDKDGAEKDVYLGLEFVKDEVPYYYGITINKGIIIEEELQISGLGKKDDITLFIRTDTNAEKNISLTFSADIAVDSDASQFRSFLENEMLERNKPAFFYMKNRKNVVFEPFKKALEWFEKDLVILLPTTKARAIAKLLEKQDQFSTFIRDTLQTLGTGIADIHIESIPIEEYFGQDDIDEAERISAKLRANPQKNNFSNSANQGVLFTLENNRVFAKKIVFTHSSGSGLVKFQYSEESDGTRKLIDLLPAIYFVKNAEKVFVIDEIERSIHPLLIKELISKYSLDKETKGQLIFSTHESNLLDQAIFRPDEIWFAEKNRDGATEIYTLSEFKEHHTIDIRKGYLNGRYGGIPFLGNLKDLNWDKYAEAN